jgi:MSHA pilin protein MshA
MVCNPVEICSRICMLSPKLLVSIHLPAKRTRAIVPGRSDRSFKVIPPGGAVGSNRLSKEVPMKKQSGFTLIELVMVIVILGVLAVTALPKFVDLKGDAQAAALQGVMGGLSSANAVNYATRSVKGTTAGSAVTTCLTASQVLQGGALPSGYSFTPSTAGTVTVAAGASVECVVTQDASSTTSTFTAIGIL